MKQKKSIRKLVLTGSVLVALAIIAIIFNLKAYGAEDKDLRWVPESCICGDLSIGTNLKCELWDFNLFTACSASEEGTIKACVDSHGYQCSNVPE